MSDVIDDEKSNRNNSNNNGLVQISIGKLVVSMLPLAILAGVCWWMGLFYISTSLLIGCGRTLLQLSLLGILLKPIFLWGDTKWWLVVGYVMFMILLAAYEASSRTKYIFQGQFLCILASLLVNISWVSLFAFGVILRPQPTLWNPRYVIPVVGMLLGNSITAVALSMDAITKSMVEQKQEIELLLSFGATKWEAISRLLGEAIAVGSTPILNTMRVIGIISIPGMMTGQILGGSTAITAARYQMLIIYLIAMSTMSVTLMNSFMAVEAGFDLRHHMLRTDRFVKSNRMRLAGILVWLLTSSLPGSYTYLVNPRMEPVSIHFNTPTINASNSASDSLTIHLMKEACSSNEALEEHRLEVLGLSRSFELPESANRGEPSAKPNRRVLFENVTLAVGPGDLILVKGPSGVGKSSLMRMMAGLDPLQEDNSNSIGPSKRNRTSWMEFDGKSWHEHYTGAASSAAWRKKVRYVTQSKVSIPGTPQDLVNRIASFASWRHDNNNGLSAMEFAGDAKEYMHQWGLGSDAFDKEWSVLSGGEAQRIIVALALASRPSILLFDECTSALDAQSKIAVENSVKDYVNVHRGGACWISHDMQQAERMASFETGGTCPGGIGYQV
jgi:putative ABC transport system permease protein